MWSLKQVGKQHRKFLKKLPPSAFPKTEGEHEIIQELEDLEAETGYAFLHLGLCSSDVVEGARDLQIIESIEAVIRPQIKKTIGAWAAWSAKHAASTTQGFTHLLPATATTWGYRTATTLEGALAPTIAILLKGYPVRGIRGAVGTEAPQELLGIDNQGFFAQTTIAAGQSPNRTFLLEIAQDMCTFAMNAHKLAADFRMGTALRTLTWSKHGRASSSLVAKNVNPTYAERVCSIARMFPALVHDIWDAGAHSYMERTLDDSAVLRMRVPEMFILFDQLLRDLQTMLQRAEPVGDVISPKAAAAETDVVRLALGGDMKSRRAAQKAVSETDYTDFTTNVGRAVENTQRVVKEAYDVINHQ